MATRTYQKINSHAQQQADAVLSTLEGVLIKTRYHIDNWIELFFELGCQCVELQFADNKPLQKQLLQNSNCGFWDCFLTRYLQDDELHLNELNPANYPRYKKHFIKTIDLTGELYYLEKHT